MGAPVRVGISSCLIGQKVRYDGGHKLAPFLVAAFGPYVEWVPVCPELELGLGVPREPIHLVAHGDRVRLVSVHSGTDHTAAMQKYAAQRTDALASLDLCGYILKKDSPSCGLMRVPVWSASGTATRTGRGLFAQALVDRFPHMPVEDEDRLSDPHVREKFVEQVFAYARLKELFAGRSTMNRLNAVYASHDVEEPRVSTNPMNPYQQALGTRDMVEALGDTPERIRSLVERMQDADFGRAHGPDKWTAAQLLNHLAETEMVFGIRVRMAVTHDDYVVQPFDQDRFMAREPRHSARDSFDAYYVMRRWNLPLYRSLTAGERERRLVHPERGSLTVSDLLGLLAGHELHHLAQLEQAVR